jgi:pantoate--beta-alanine ligase
MMRVWESVSEWRERRRALDGREIGFVPTMGALHGGHATLVKRCRRENEIGVVSIFVNPTQFNDPRDLERYPRNLNDDLALLEALGMDEVFVPQPKDIYPHGYRYRIVEEDLTRLMEGACRPGFFQGVMTVVLKLLNLVRPARAYFGEKDYQQLRLIQEMTKEFFISTEIVACPTVREESGLAASSRNVLLSAAGREKAAVMAQALSQAQTCAQAAAMLEAAGFLVEYVEEHFGRRFAAARIEGVRLIDNVPAVGCEANAPVS